MTKYKLLKKGLAVHNIFFKTCFIFFNIIYGKKIFAQNIDTNIDYTKNSNNQYLIENNLFDIKNLFKLTFQTDEQKELINATGFANCQFYHNKTEQLYDKNLNIAMKNCLENKKNITNNKNFYDLTNKYINKLGTRLANKIILKNNFTQNILNGKIEIDFSLTKIKSIFIKEKLILNKPTYQYQKNVAILNKNKTKEALNDKKMLLNIPKEEQNLIIDQTIIENFEANNNINLILTSETEQKFSLGKFMQNYLNLNYIPYQNFKFIIQRTKDVNAIRNINLIFSDDTNKTYVDITKAITNHNLKYLTFVLFIPYQHSGLTIVQNTFEQKTSFSLIFAEINNLNISVSYNPNTNMSNRNILGDTYNLKLTYNL